MITRQSGGFDFRLMTTKETQKNRSDSREWSKSRALTVGALISCLTVYGVTISLFNPFLSLLLEQRGTAASSIGALAMAAPIGVLVGSFLIPKLMRSYEGRSMLLFGVSVEVVLILGLMLTESFGVWFVIRFFGGLTGAILFLVTETWIIEIVPVKDRGKVLGLYNTALALSFAIGPLVLSLTGASGTAPYIIGVVAMLVASIPLLFSGTYRSSAVDSPRFGVIGFFWVAPLLVVGIFAAGFKEVALGSLLPVYGVRIGLSESTATLMLFFGAIGAAVMQFPIGWAADVFNVRKVFVSCAILSLSGAIIWPLVIYSPFLLWPILFLWAGSYAGFYTISMILAGQWFKGSELATAMAAFGVFWGVGAFAGPAVSGIAMDVWDPYGLPFILVLLSLVIFVLSLRSNFYRPRRV